MRPARRLNPRTTGPPAGQGGESFGPKPAVNPLSGAPQIGVGFSESCQQGRDRSLRGKVQRRCRRRANIPKLSLTLCWRTRSTAWLRGGGADMKSKLLTRWPALLGVAALLSTGVASAGEVRVMISAGFFDVYAELGPAFGRATGHRLVTTRGPSTGDSPEAIPTRLARGMPDVILAASTVNPTESVSRIRFLLRISCLSRLTSAEG